jgi:hypothetical protein
MRKKNLHDLTQLLLITSLVAMGTLSCSKKPEECIDDVAKNAKTESGVAVGVANCRADASKAISEESKILNDGKRVVRSIDEVASKCYVFWDGRRWQLGKTEGPNFGRFSREKYGVELVELAIPRQMINELKVNTEVGDTVTSNQFNEFLNLYWNQVESLCKF